MDESDLEDFDNFVETYWEDQSKKRKKNIK